MTWYIVTAALVVIALPVLAKVMERYPRLYCALHGHVPRCSIENCGVMKWHCDHCNREVGRQ